MAKRRRKGYVDEAGRGPLFGDVVAACVVFKNGAKNRLGGVKDSKKMTDKRRRERIDDIYEYCFVGVGIATVAEINELNILRATLLAMKRAVLDCSKTPTEIWIDGNVEIPDVVVKQKTVVGGDRKVLGISCASVVAKVARDDMMLEYAEYYPEYGLESHKGYGTAMHITAIKKHGMTPLHRTKFCEGVM